LAKITMPVLVIHGTKDRNAPYGGGREWAMSLPDARLVTVEGAAHVSWADDPIAVFGSIREFLRGNWPLTAEKVTVLDPQP
jgi:pimeloyl-ACP methyl ester carboxylesterase